MSSVRLVLLSGSLIACGLALISIPAARSQTQTQVTNSGRCNAILVKSVSRNVTVNCGYSSQQISALIASLNRATERGNLSESALDQIIEQINAFLAEGLTKQDNLISRTDIIEQKLDKLLNFIETYQNSPRELGPALAQISANALSYTRTSGPLTLQIVGAYSFNDKGYTNSKNVRFIFRLGNSGDVQPDFIIAKSRSFFIKSYINLQIADKWEITGDKGTACVFRTDSPGMTIKHASHVESFHTYNAGEKLSKNEIPLTIVINAVCPDFVEKDPLDVRIRLYYRMPATREATANWQAADFRFGGVTPASYSNAR